MLWASGLPSVVPSALGDSWVVISGVIRRVTTVITHIGT